MHKIFDAMATSVYVWLATSGEKRTLFVVLVSIFAVIQEIPRLIHLLQRMSFFLSSCCSLECWYVGMLCV